MTWSPEGGHSLPASTRARIRARDRTCRWITQRGPCRSTDRLQVDHRTPVAEGGTDEDANLWLLCHAHHARKTAREAARGRARVRGRRTRPPEQHPGRLTR